LSSEPENIMVVGTDHDDEIQIADFGLSKFAAPEEVMSLPCGTLAYVAPEVLQMQGYGREVDLWSVGVIAFVLLRGRLPFDGKVKSQIISKTVAGKIPFEGDPVWEKISEQAKDLITNLLQVEPSKRFTSAQALAHPWFSLQMAKPERRKSKARVRRSVITPQTDSDHKSSEDNDSGSQHQHSGVSISQEARISDEVASTPTSGHKKSTQFKGE
jgi:serine/threonine protein kinase